MPPELEKYYFPDDKEKFDLDKFIASNKVPLASSLIGLILLGVGGFLYKKDSTGSGDVVEVISATNQSSAPKKEIVVEISGEILKPGVYKLVEGSRIEDLLIASEGFSGNADREWAQKYVNRAAKLIDGQKLYIPTKGEQSEEASANNLGQVKLDQQVLGVENQALVNINTASLVELDSLPGIGQVYGQKIIEHRPYSTIEELVSKGAVKQNVFEKFKDRVSVY